MLAFISDLHAGRADKADACLLTDRELIALFERILLRACPLVMVGDILELLRSGLPWNDGAEFSEIAKARPLFITWFHRAVMDGRVVLVNGNHDQYLRQILFVPCYLTGGIFPGAVKKWIRGPLLAEHGHHADFVAHKLPFLSRLGAWFFGCLVRAGLMDEDSPWRRWGEAFPPGAALDLATFHEYARKRTAELGCTIGIFGHTHTPEGPRWLAEDNATMADAIRYANCGAWAGKRDGLPVIFFNEKTMELSMEIISPEKGIQ